MKKKLSSLMSLALVGATALTGCGNGGSQGTAPQTEASSSTQTTGPNGEALASEQVANGMLFNVITFDTAQVADNESGSFFLATGEGLFRENNGILENTGCESYDVSEDGLTYTFHLRKNK